MSISVLVTEDSVIEITAALDFAAINIYSDISAVNSVHFEKCKKCKPILKFIDNVFWKKKGIEKPRECHNLQPLTPRGRENDKN